MAVSTFGYGERGRLDPLWPPDEKNEDLKFLFFLKKKNELKKQRKSDPTPRLRKVILDQKGPESTIECVSP